MSHKTRKKFKWFWLWQDAKQEEWLRGMSQDGWHLKSPGIFVFTFESGPAKDYSYRLDHFNRSKMAILEDPADRRQEYLDLFEDAGWEHLGQANGWQYFRTSPSPERSHRISIEAEPKLENYRRLLRNLLFTSPVVLIVFLWRLEVYPPWFAALLVTVFTAGMLFWGLNSVMIFSRMRQLRAK